MADHAANFALHIAEDFSSGELSAIKESIRENAQVRLSTDGALKGDGQAAAGMAIMVYRGGHYPITLYRAGRVLGPLKSAFEAELLALCWGLTSFYAIVNDT